MGNSTVLKKSFQVACLSAVTQIQGNSMKFFSYLLPFNKKVTRKIDLFFNSNL